MTNTKLHFEKLSKSERKKAFVVAPLLFLASPIILPYTFIRNTIEGGQTIRGWADETFWGLAEVAQYLFLGGYYSGLGGDREEREKIREFRKTGASKTICKAFVKYFGDWRTFSDKTEKYLCYKWTSDYSEEWLYLTYKDKDRYAFSHTDYSYGSKSKKPNIHCSYQLTEEQALAVLEAWAKK